MDNSHGRILRVDDISDKEMFEVYVHGLGSDVRVHVCLHDTATIEMAEDTALTVGATQQTASNDIRRTVQKELVLKIPNPDNG